MLRQLESGGQWTAQENGTSYTVYTRVLADKKGAEMPLSRCKRTQSHL